MVDNSGLLRWLAVCLNDSGLIIEETEPQNPTRSTLWRGQWIFGWMFGDWIDWKISELKKRDWRQPSNKLDALERSADL